VTGRRTVLVTGGAGFIGGHVSTALLDAGHDVRILDVLLPQAWHGATPDVDPRAAFVVGDATHPTVVREVLDGVDVVCHHAAMVGMGVDIRDQPAFVTNNDLATAVLLAEMTRAGVANLVLASSMVVYGEGRYRCRRHGAVHPGPRRQEDLSAGRFEHQCPACGDALEWVKVDEDDQLEPRSTYAATKVAQEHLAAAWQRETSADVIALRYHNVYGPWMPRDTPYSGVAAIFRSALEAGRAPEVFEDGRQTRDFVHVSDVAHANVLAVERPSGGTFTPVNIASGQPVTIADVACTLSATLDAPHPHVTGRYRSGDVRQVVASPDRAERLLGFRAAVSPAAGLAAFATAALRGHDLDGRRAHIQRV